MKGRLIFIPLFSPQAPALCLAIRAKPASQSLGTILKRSFKITFFMKNDNKKPAVEIEAGFLILYKKAITSSLRLSHHAF
jgi:hypothetical protein